MFVYNCVTFNFWTMKRKYKQWWSTIPPISTNRTISSHLKSPNITKTTTHGVRNPDPRFGPAQKCKYLNSKHVLKIPCDILSKDILQMPPDLVLTFFGNSEVCSNWIEINKYIFLSLLHFAFTCYITFGSAYPIYNILC